MITEEKQAVQIAELLRAKRDDFKAREKTYKADNEKFSKALVEWIEQTGSDFMSYGSELGIGKPDNIKCSVIRQKSVVWDIMKLQKNFPKEVRDRMIDRKVTVNDWDGFSKYLARLGANPKLVKSFLDVEKSVNAEGMDELFREGKISWDGLEGCFEVKYKAPYIKFQETE